MRKVLVILVAFLWAYLGTSEAFALSCMPEKTSSERYESMEYIFTAKVRDLQADDPRIRSWALDVLEVWKGDVPREVIYSFIEDSLRPWDVTLVAGKTYLVFSHDLRGKFVDLPICRAPIDLSDARGFRKSIVEHVLEKKPTKIFEGNSKWLNSTN